MENKSEIDNWVNDVMTGFDGISKVEANPFLFGKIQSRLGANIKEAMDYKGVYTIATMLFVLVVLNVYSYSSLSRHTNGEKTPVTGIEAFATEYDFHTTGDNI